MELKYERQSSRGKTIRRTIDVAPTFDDYLNFIETKADPGSSPWTKESAEKVSKIVKWLFDNGHLVEDTFDEDDDFRDYLHEGYGDCVDWPYEPEDERDC